MSLNTILLTGNVSLNIISSIESQLSNCGCKAVFAERDFGIIAGLTMDVDISVTDIAGKNELEDFDAIFIVSDENSEGEIAKWVGNAHLRVIPYMAEEKQTEALKEEIKFFMGIPEPVEIERKFLIEYPDTEMLEGLSCCRKVDISQTYLIYGNGEKTRVRKRGIDGKNIYIQTTKKKISQVKRIEIENRLTEAEYESFLNDIQAEKYQISKERYCLVYKNQYFEIDVFPFWQNKAIMEIELKNEADKFELPDFINVIREVTEDKEYSNYVLARKVSH